MLSESLLCILLHLTLIHSPGTYTYQELTACEAANQADIDQIHADPILENSIVQTNSPQLELLDIWYDDAED